MDDVFPNPVPTEIVGTELKDKDYERYTESFQEYRRQLPKLISEGLKSNNPKTHYISAEMIEYAPEEEQERLRAYLPEIIEKGREQECIQCPDIIKHAPKETRGILTKSALESNDYATQGRALKIIQFVPEEERSDLISSGLSHKDPFIRGKAANEIQHAPLEARSNLISKVLDDYDPYVRSKAIPNIQYARTEDRINLITKGLQDSDPDVRAYTALTIEFAPEELRKGLAQQGLNDPNIAVQNSFISTIKHVPEEERVGLINQALMFKEADMRAKAISMIEHTKLEDRIPLINKGLSDPSGLVRAMAIKMTQYAPENERLVLVEKALEDPDDQVRSEAILMVEHIPINNREKLLIKGINDSNVQTLSNAISMIKFAPINLRAKLIRKVLRSRVKDYFKTKTISMISYTTENDKKSLQKEFKGKFLKDNAGKPLTFIAQYTPLYNDITGERHKEDFPKSGSYTTLLLGPLKEKAILRIIRPDALFHWKKAFENTKYWQEKGFNYVPIEPIIGVQPADSIEEIGVLTRVIPGPSVGTWLENSYIWRDEILKQVETITNSLEDLGIDHGHIHSDNFLVYFPRDENGEPDLFRKPQVYMIDFDQSRSS